MTRDLQQALSATTERQKRASQKKTVAQKAGVIKISECRALSITRAKEEQKKKERAEIRKGKASENPTPNPLPVIEYLLGDGPLKST